MVNYTTIKESDAIDIRASVRKCLSPKELNIVEIIKDTKRGDADASVFQMFLTDDELQKLKELL